MTKYDEVTDRAFEMLRSDKQVTPPDAWRQAAEEIFVGSPASVEKSCPKNAFFGLCEIGAIEGVAPGRYGSPTASMNKNYAVRALAALYSTRILH